MDGIDIDLSDLWPLAGDLEASGGKVLSGVQGVMEKAAVNVKRGMQSDFRTTGHARRAWAAIDYDIRTTFSGSVEAEVGFNKSKPQGALGNLLAFGSSKNAPVADITASARREQPTLAQYLSDLVGESLG